MVCINPNWAELKYRKNSKLNVKTGHITLKGTPYLDFNGKNKNFPVKCHKCPGCKLDHASEVACRIWMEAEEHEQNCFVTLTYNQKNLPLSKNNLPTLSVPDTQNFLKRLRFELKDTKISYVISGEYGPKTLRPHYHIALLGWMPNDLKEHKKNKQGDMLYTSKKLEKIWGKGIVMIGMLSQQSASYIARYVTKKIHEKDHTRMGTEKEFIHYSTRPATGLTNWLKHKDQYIKNGGIYIKVKDKVRLFPIPTYFQKKRQQELYQDYKISPFYAPVYSYYDEEHKEIAYRATSTKDALEFEAQADFLADCILQETYYTDKLNGIEKAKKRMEELKKQTDLEYKDYLKIIEEKLKKNLTLLKRDQI